MNEDERRLHRLTAAKAFNETWELLEKKRRSREDDRRMLNLAHASRYHWALVGTDRNLSVGDWQLSRVYASLERPELAELFAESCLERVKREGLAGLLPSALEGMARAFAVSGQKARARRMLEDAEEALAGPGIDPEDREVFRAQIRKTSGLLR